MMFRKFLVAVLLISIIAYGSADTYMVTITPSGTPACTIGAQITAECVCDGSTETSGYCCASGQQTGACVATCTETNNLTGDVEGEVNILDLIMVASRMGGTDVAGDANCDGVIDINDLFLIVNNYT